MAGPCRELGRGELHVEGDIACEQGDIVALAAIAQHLLEHAREPLHCELEPLARACGDPRTAAEAWRRFKELIEAPA